MKRLLLAGVSLSVTACAMPSASPPKTASLSAPSGSPSAYLLSLAATPECTIWRDVGGSRVCLDSAAPAAVPTAAPAAPTPAARFAREAGEDFNDRPLHRTPTAKGPAAETPKSNAKPAVAARIADAEAPAVPKRTATLFDEMKRIGMLDANARPVGALPRVRLAQQNSAPALPALPKLPGASASLAELPRLPVAAQSIAPQPANVRTAGITTPPVMAPADLPELPKAARGVIAPPPAQAVKQAFAADPVEAAAKPARKSGPAAAKPESASWKPVDQSGRPVQVAASDIVSRAPVAPVERAELPAVRSDAVVPLKITEKAADGRPAKTAPAVPLKVAPAPTSVAANPGAAPELPPLPNLPQSPQATAPAPKPIVAPAPATVAAPPPSRPAAQPVAPAMPRPAAASRIKPAAVQATAPQSPAAKATAKPAAKAAAGKLHAVTPGAGPVPPSGARYLVIHSFTDQAKASQAAQRYSHLGATVATAQINGQTWHRVVVRDGVGQRDRLTADGVRGYWPVTL